jgi:hypothetical protein
LEKLKTWALLEPENPGQSRPDFTRGGGTRIARLA